MANDAEGDGAVAKRPAAATEDEFPKAARPKRSKVVEDKEPKDAPLQQLRVAREKAAKKAAATRAANRVRGAAPLEEIDLTSPDDKGSKRRKSVKKGSIKEKVAQDMD